MLQVARTKAAARKLEAAFCPGDMRSCEFDRKFDAVIGLYALTTLVRDEDLAGVFLNVHRALREKGVFYFNLLNAGVEAPPEYRAPAVFMDVAVSEPGLCLTRLNRTSWSGDVQNWLSLYLFDEGRGMQLAIGDHPLRFRYPEQVRQDLERTGFCVETVSYRDVQGLKAWDMRILASNAGC
jgi:SAM-dependent methyltransferase